MAPMIANQNLTVIDATPRNIMSPEVPRRLKIAYGDQPMKFLIALRDPIERMWSHWNFNRELYLATVERDYANVTTTAPTYPQLVSFEESIDIELNLVSACMQIHGNVTMLDQWKYCAPVHTNFNIVWRSMYDQQLALWKQVYPEDHYYCIVSQVSRSEYFIWSNLSSTMIYHTGNAAK